MLWNSVVWLLRNTRLSEKVEMVKNHPFAVFCSIAHVLYSIGFSQPWRKSCKIPGFFASWNFLMYYSNKRLKPTTACVIVKWKKHVSSRSRTNKLLLYKGHVCFLFAIFSCALPHISTSARKKLCSVTLTKYILEISVRIEMQRSVSVHFDWNIQRWTTLTGWTDWTGIYRSIFIHWSVALLQ